MSIFLKRKILLYLRLPLLADKLMEQKGLFVHHQAIGYEFTAEKLVVRSPQNTPIERYYIFLKPLDISIIEQDKNGNWVAVVEQGAPFDNELLQKIGLVVVKHFTKLLS